MNRLYNELGVPSVGDAVTTKRKKNIINKSYKLRLPERCCVLTTYRSNYFKLGYQIHNILYLIVGSHNISLETRENVYFNRTK